MNKNKPLKLDEYIKEKYSNYGDKTLRVILNILCWVFLGFALAKINILKDFFLIYVSLMGSSIWVSFLSDQYKEVNQFDREFHFEEYENYLKDWKENKKKLNKIEKYNK